MDDNEVCRLQGFVENFIFIMCNLFVFIFICFLFLLLVTNKHFTCMCRKNEVLNLSFSFSLNVIEFCELLEQKRKFVLSKQLLRSGTSIGACIREGQQAESKADFCHKLKIASKEAEETEYWLLLCKMSPYYPTPENLLVEIISLKKLLNKIISTVKRNLRSPKTNS